MMEKKIMQEGGNKKDGVTVIHKNSPCNKILSIKTVTWRLTHSLISLFVHPTR